MWYVLGKEGTEEPYIVAHDEDAAYAKARSMYGDGVKLEQDEDVLDTWFSRLATTRLCYWKLPYYVL